MNDDSDRRRRSADPAWPTDEDQRKRRETPQERTGFWSPSWEDDDASASAGGRGQHGGARPGGGKPAWPTEDEPGRTRHVAGPPPGTPPPGARSGAPGARPPAGPQRGARPGPPPGTPMTGPADGPTDYMPPVPTGARPEPALLTHREPAIGEPEDDRMDDSRELPPYSTSDKRWRKRKIWRRVRRGMYMMVALMVIGPIIAFFVAYQLVTVPTPETVAANEGQAVTIKYAGGKVMTKIAPAGSNRTMVTYHDIPQPVLHAVYAAEDASFETNSGFDVTGILRAAWNQVSGGTGGGSTITQQYIKKATENEQHTLTRKGLEVVKAYKMSNTYNKQDIITAYLNTIYFGRGANGIQAAAQAYFKKDVKNLTVQEGAVLAGLIQGPSRSEDTAYRTRRWTYVMDQLVQHGWLSPQERAASKMPKLIDKSKSKAQHLTRDMYLVQQQVLAETSAKLGISEDEIQREGLTIQTTIDPNAQKYAEDAVKQVMDGEPKNLRPALVAIAPNTGEILAYYGGTDYLDWADQIQEPGSSFKPFDLVALLEQGGGLGNTYDGSDGRTFPASGRTAPVHNAGPSSSCSKQCTVAEAMKRSVNTVFYDMALQLGVGKVRDAAFQAGIPQETTSNGKKVKLLDKIDGNISIGGGTTQVRTTDMAAAYASFADGGTRHTPHMVSKVFNPDGSVKYAAQDDHKPAFDPNSPEINAKIARNVTESLLPIPDWSHIPCDPPHQCAGKTGTQQYADGNTAANANQNAKAWMVGYTQQISTAVSMSAQTNKPIINSKGNPIYGSGLPGHIWQAFMNHFLKGKPPQPWPPYIPLGKAAPDDGGVYGTSGTTDSSSQQNTTTEQPTRHRPTKTKNPPTTTTTDGNCFPVGCPGTTTTTTPDPSSPGHGSPGG